MTLFIREIRGNFKSFIIWISCIITLTAMFMAMYPSFADQGSALEDMLKGFSPQLMQMFGFDSIDFSRTMDYYSYMYQYVFLAALMQFMLLGASLLSKEEDSGTINFLYAKPLSRVSIAGTKIIAGTAQIAAFFIINTAAVIAILSAVDRTGVDYGAVMLLGVSMALGQLMMMGIGMLLSMFVIRARSVMSASIGIILVLFAASMFANINDSISWLKYITPFQYFDARNIITNGALDTVFTLLAAGVALAGFASSILIYNRRDLKC